MPLKRELAGWLVMQKEDRAGRVIIEVYKQEGSISLMRGQGWRQALDSDVEFLKSVSSFRIRRQSHVLQVGQVVAELEDAFQRERAGLSKFGEES